MPAKDLRLLALDGGGIRGLSSLQILRELMRSINPNSPPKPCDYFDMIGGTSTGGLIAIMLGRLEMSMDDCIQTYVSLSDKVFQKTRQPFTIRGNVQGRFDSKELEDTIRRIVKKQGIDENALLEDSPDPKCKVFVCAIRKETTKPVHLRSYRTNRGDGGFVNPKIWEAARATSAASSFFDPIKIGPLGQEFVDGGAGANNPVYEVWNEAQDIWEDGRLEDNIKCLVSIGTGRPSPDKFGDDFIQIGRSLMALSTETENTAENFARDKRKLYDDRRYFRFNVDKGLERIRFEDSSQMKAICAATSDYLESQLVLNLKQSFSMLSKFSTTLGDSEDYYVQEGCTAYNAGEWTQAVTLLKQALDGKNHSRLDDDGIAEIRQYYAEALYHVEQYDLARVHLQTQVAWAENKFGKQHVKTMKRRMSWGYALYKCSLSGAAREQFKLAALGFERASNGEDTLDSLRCRYMHGMLASAHEAYDRSWSRWPEAEESLRRAVQGFTRFFKPEESENFDAQMGYATVLLKMCRDKESCDLFKSLLVIATQKRDPQSQQTIKKIKRDIKECEYWLGQPLAIRNADRLITARKRAEKQLQKESWREDTGHWSKG